MTVDDESNKDSFPGDGVATVFPYTFRILGATEILVTLADSAGVETEQIKDTNYTVSGVGDQTGGNITMIVAPAAGETLVFTRNTPLTQGLDLTKDGPLPAESVEVTLDRAIMLIQEQQELLDRTIRQQVTSSGVNPELPAPEADKAIGYNSNGDGFVNIDTGADQAAAAAASANAAANSASNALNSEQSASNSENNAAQSAVDAAASAASGGNFAIVLAAQTFS